ncbi:hypothetical protein, partial [Candidatus Poriferisocius sp.]|uniref:hypothetical protein n=1 Tax=Candidatus Poriferisocius sp. TaxID=3101276 RepID=UPI003B51DCB8
CATTQFSRKFSISPQYLGSTGFDRPMAVNRQFTSAPSTQLISRRRALRAVGLFMANVPLSPLLACGKDSKANLLTSSEEESPSGISATSDWATQTIAAA